MVSTLALMLGTSLDHELTSNLDVHFSYRSQFTNQASGRYNHHMVGGFSVELSSWLDFDVSLVWDRIQQPQADPSGNLPDQDDWRLIVGLGFEF